MERNRNLRRERECEEIMHEFCESGELSAEEIVQMKKTHSLCSAINRDHGSGASVIGWSRD